MPAIKFGKVNTKAAMDDEAENIGYNGPTPPPGPYTGVVKRLELKTNKNGDPMLKGVAELKAPKGHKNFKFNGYGVWFNLNVTDQGMPYVNLFLASISGGDEETFAKAKKAFWGGRLMTEKPLPSKANSSAGFVLRIGPIKIDDPEGESKLAVAFTTRKSTGNDGVERLELRRFMRPAVEQDEDEDDDEYEDEDEALEDVEDGSEDTENEDLEDDDDEDEYEDEDDEDDSDEEDDAESDDDEDDGDEDEDGEADGEDDEDDEDDEPEAPVTPIAKKRSSAKKRTEPVF